MWKKRISGLVLKFTKPSTRMREYQEGVDAFERGDYLAAYEKWEPLATLGIADAQHNLGALYEYGHGVPQNYAEAAKWYRRAAEQGHSTAQHNLGVLYANGQGVAQHYGYAGQWWQKAAEQRFIPAQVKLGLLYYNGYGVARNYATAYAWFNLGAVQGDATGQRCRDLLAKQMSAEQLEKAHRLFRQYYERYVVLYRSQRSVQQTAAAV